MKMASLTQNSQFRRLYRRGRSVVNHTMVIYVMKNRHSSNRLGITAGKKVGGAVQRNRAKRRIRELFRIFQGQLKQSYDFCIVARTYTVNAPYEKLVRDFKASAEKLGVWNDETADD